MRAPHSRTALSTMTSKTGWTSVGDPAMTLRISAVAVCRSSASLVSLNRRTFSIAMTAWSAKVDTSPICLSVNGLTASDHTAITPMMLPSRSIGTPSMERNPPRRWASLQVPPGVTSQNVWNVHWTSACRLAPLCRPSCRDRAKSGWLRSARLVACCAGRGRPCSAECRRRPGITTADCACEKPLRAFEQSRRTPAASDRGRAC